MPPASAKSTPAGGLKPFLPPLLLFVGTFVVYAGCLHHRFLTTWDDNVYITANMAIRGFTFDHVRTAFSTFFLGNYAPLHLISYMLDYSLWGLNPAGFIFTNVLLHALNGVLFYLIALNLLGRRAWAFPASFIFLFHPVQVESVAWISQRKNVLAMTLFLIAFHLYMRYRSGHNPKTSCFLSLAAFTGALLTKSVTVILPAVLILYDLCFLPKESRRRLLADKVPYALLAIAAAALTFVSQSAQMGGGRIPAVDNPLSVLFTMLPVFVRYLGLVFCPTGLSACYDVPVRHGIDGTVILSGVVLLVIGAGALLLYRTRRRLFFGLVLFLLGLLPVSQIVPIATLITDRYLYFPLLGAALCLGETASLLWEGRERIWAQAGMGLGGAALLVLPFMSVYRASAWENDFTLWRDATAKSPGSSFVWTQLGSAHHKAGDLDGALVQYRHALALTPRDFTALKNIALTHMKKREFDQARVYLQRLVELYPGYAQGHEDLGLIRRMVTDGEGR